MENKDFFQLIKEAKDPIHRIRLHYDLRISGNIRTQSYLLNIVMDNSIDEESRAAAIDGFTYPKSKEAILALRALLAITPETSSFLTPIIEGLGLQQDTESGEKIIKYLSSEHKESLRYISAQALGRIAFLPAIPYLQKMLKDSSGVIRHYASSALINIFESVKRDRKIYDIVPDLEPLLNDPEKIIREHIQFFLSTVET